MVKTSTFFHLCLWKVWHLKYIFACSWNRRFLVFNQLTLKYIEYILFEQVSILKFYPLKIDLLRWSDIIFWFLFFVLCFEKIFSWFIRECFEVFYMLKVFYWFKTKRSGKNQFCRCNFRVLFDIISYSSRIIYGSHGH